MNTTISQEIPRYRIISNGRLFRPQRRFLWLLWIDMPYSYGDTTRWGTYEEAHNVIQEYKEMMRKQGGWNGWKTIGTFGK